MKNKPLFPILAVGFALAALATTINSGQAALITLQNPSFELNDASAGPTSALTGWVKSGSGNDWNSFAPGAGDTPPVSGTQTYLATNLFAFSIVGQFIFQRDLILVQPNTTYTFSLNVAGRTTASGSPFGYGGYVAQIGVGDFNTDANFSTLAVSNGAGTGAFDKPFEFITFSFTTPVNLTSTTVRAGSQFDSTAPTTTADITGQYLRVGFGMPLSAAGGQLDSTQTLVDVVSFDATAVPEPSTWAFLGLGLVAIALLRRRSRVS